MRTLIVAGGYPPEMGGVEVGAEHIARGLNRRGHRIVVITGRRGPQPRRYVHAGVRVLRLPFAIPTRKAFPVLFLPAFFQLLWVLLLFRPRIIYVHFVAEYAPCLALLARGC